MRTQVRIFKSCNLCPDSYRSRWSGMAFHSFLQRRSAPRKMVHLPSLNGNFFYSVTVKSAFYDRSRMTGRYSILFCKKTLFTFLLQLAPFVGFAATFPDKRGRLEICMLSLFSHHSGTAFGMSVFVLWQSWCLFVWVISLFFLLIQKEQQGVYASFCSFVFLYFPCLNYTFL